MKKLSIAQGHRYFRHPQTPSIDTAHEVPFGEEDVDRTWSVMYLFFVELSLQARCHDRCFPCICIFSFDSLTAQRDRCYVIHTLPRRKLRLREVLKLAHSHMATNC